jgi:hypothetical protein
MVKSGILSKRVDRSNERFKVLENGPVFDRFIDKLNNV